MLHFSWLVQVPHLRRRKAAISRHAAIVSLMLISSFFPSNSTAAAINLGVCVVMDSWAPTKDSVLPYFALMGLWGLADGIYVSQTNSE